MFEFNFLSTTEQKRYVRWVLLQHASIGLILTTIFLIAISGVVIVAQLSIDTLARAAQQESTVLTATSKQLSSSETAATQKTLQHLQVVQSEYQPYLHHIDVLLSSIPANVALDSIDIDYATNEMYISGTAQDRQAFIQFQQNVEESAEIEIVEVPLDLLAKTTDITFRLRLAFTQQQ